MDLNVISLDYEEKAVLLPAKDLIEIIFEPVSQLMVNSKFLDRFLY